MGYDLVLRSRRVVLPGGVRPGAVAVRREKIAAIAGYDARLDAARDDDLADLALLPGLVDTHVHVNEPGRTEWEGFATATRAAAACGVTTICDMPLNSLPPTVTTRALRAKRAAAAGQCAVDVAFWGGAVPGSQPELRGLHEAGVTGFKCFLADSGVPEFPPLDAAGLRAAMAETGRVGSVLAVHAEDPRELGEAAGSDHRSFLASRPPRAERRAVETVIAAAARTGSRAHVVHLSAAGCVPVIREAKGSGVAMTAETCPHYLFFAAEEVPRGGTEFKCCPPIRDAANREALWRGLESGVIDCVVSDHSPCPPALKRRESGDFGAAWGGIGSLQLGLAAVWTVARRRGQTLADVARWMAAAPAALAGLPGKGVIAAGYDADLVAFDPDAAFTVHGADLQHRSPVTPYEGRVLAGTVRQVWLRGQVITPDSRPAGRLLGREGTTAMAPSVTTTGTTGEAGPRAEII
jgi:allantoinase